MKSEATVFSTWVRDDELRHPDDSGNGVQPTSILRKDRGHFLCFKW